MSLMPRTNGAALPVKNRLKHFAEGAVAAGVHMHLVDRGISDIITNLPGSADVVPDFDLQGRT